MARLAALALLLGPCAASWHPLRRAPQPVKAFDKSVLGNLKNAGEVANPRMSRSHMFVADITVGAPPQTLSCLLDSGSADIWVPSKRCKDCGTQHTFQADKSETFMPAIVHTPHGDMPVPVEVDDSGGQIVGFIVQDRIGLGPWVFKNQSFLIVEESHLPKHRAWDGICGLGWKGMTSSVEPLYRNLQKHHGYATFALVPSSPGQTYLVVGEVPEQLHHTVAWAEAEPLKRGGKRSFWVASGGVGSNEQGPVPTRFVIDSGTSFILAPRKHYTKFLRQLIPRHLFDHLCGADPAGDNLVVCDCSIMDGEAAKNQFMVYLGGRRFPLPLPKLFKRVPTTDGGELCLLHMQQNSMTSVNPIDLLNALLGGGIGIKGDSAKGGPAHPAGPGPGAFPGLVLPPFLMPTAGAPQIEEITETRPDGKVCTTTLVWSKGDLKENRTKCRGRRLQLQLPGLVEDEMSEMWVLGGAFLEHFVTVFDFENHRLGFGRMAEGLAETPLEALPAQEQPARPPERPQRPVDQEALRTRTAQRIVREERQVVRDFVGTESDEQSGGGSGWGAVIFGTIALALGGSAFVVFRKMHTRRDLTAPLPGEREDCAELYEDADNGAAVAE